jgi:hypothetical protein
MSFKGHTACSLCDQAALEVITAYKEREIVGDSSWSLFTSVNSQHMDMFTCVYRLHC